MSTIPDSDFHLVGNTKNTHNQEMQNISFLSKKISGDDYKPKKNICNNLEITTQIIKEVSRPLENKCNL